MPVILASPALSAVINLAQVTFTLDLPTSADSGSGNYNAQIFLLRKSDGGYEAITPRNADLSPVRIAIFGSGVRNTASFMVLMKPDEYTTGQVVLFAEGTNFTDPSPVSFAVAVDVIVTSTHIRLTKPTFEIDPVIVGADGKITVPYIIRYPSDVTLFNAADNNVLPYGGFIVMVKGDVLEKSGAPTDWVTVGASGNPQQFTLTNVDGDSFYQYNGKMILTPTATGGVKNVQGGLFNQTWSTDFGWVWPGQDFAVGQWEQLADPAHYPAIAAAFAKPAGYPALSGNFGNAIASIGKAANDTAAYFGLLAGLGMKSLRMNYSADRYLTDDLYTQEVDQVAQHMMLAGIVPCLAPQGLPSGAHLADQEAALVTLGAKVAAKYKGVPVVIDVLNEPYQYATWATWKPVAQRVIDAIKAADPNASIVVGTEGFSKDMTAASADPFAPGTVFAYGWHPYLAAADLAKQGGSGIPVWAQEYQDGSTEFHTALAALPHVFALAAWAWTTPGQDSLNLVASVDGASLTLTPTGKAIAAIYAAWKAGTALPVPVPVPIPVPPATGGGTPVAGGITMADVQAALDAQKTAIDAEITSAVAADATRSDAAQTATDARVTAVEATQVTDEATQVMDEAKQVADEAAAATLAATLTTQVTSAAAAANSASSVSLAAYKQAAAANAALAALKASIPGMVSAASAAEVTRQLATLSTRKPADHATVADLLAIINAG